MVVRTRVPTPAAHRAVAIHLVAGVPIRDQRASRY
jgi:hypothetical protein